MGSKIYLTEEEMYGLTEQQIKAARLYLRKYTTKGILNDLEAIPLFELFMIGFSFEDIHHEYPRYPYGQICLTGALKKWVRSREMAAMNIFDRIRNRLIRSATEQVDFLSNLIVVNSLEQKEAIRKYISDPVNNPPPDMRIKSLKDYQAVMDMLGKIVSSVKEISPNPELSRLPTASAQKIAELPEVVKAKNRQSKLLEELAGGSDDSEDDDE